MNSRGGEKHNQLLLNSETELQGSMALTAAADGNPKPDMISGTLLQSKALFLIVKSRTETQEAHTRKFVILWLGRLQPAFIHLY